MLAGAVITIKDDDLTVLPTEVSIFASNPNANILSKESGQFVISRSGPLDQQLYVSFLLTGSGDYLRDYTFDSYLNSAGAPPAVNTIAIPAGQASLPLTLTPTSNGLDTFTKSAQLTLATSYLGDYVINPERNTAKVILAGTPIINVTATAPEARVTSDLGPVNGEFTFTREGDLSQNLVVNYGASGSATGGVQYKALKGVVTIPAGSAEARVRIKPLKNGPAGKATVKVTLKAGGNYVLGAATRAEVKVFGGG